VVRIPAAAPAMKKHLEGMGGGRACSNGALSRFNRGVAGWRKPDAFAVAKSNPKRKNAQVPDGRRRNCCIDAQPPKEKKSFRDQMSGTF